MKKNKILAIAIAVCLVAIIACGSLAYFSDSSTATNKFMVASYDPENPFEDPDEIFDVTVEETVDKEDKNVKKNEIKDDNGYDYSNILPGDTLKKTVVVKNTGKYGEYVRANVTFSNAKAWKATLSALKLGDNLTVLLDKLDIGEKGNWELKTTTPDEKADTITYVFYYKSELAAGSPTSALFESVKIPEKMTAEQFVDLQSFTVTVTADAIQSKNTASNAFDAFKLF